RSNEALQQLAIAAGKWLGDRQGAISLQRLQPRQLTLDRQGRLVPSAVDPEHEALPVSGINAESLVFGMIDQMGAGPIQPWPPLQRWTNSHRCHRHGQAPTDWRSRGCRVGPAASN